MSFLKIVCPYPSEMLVSQMDGQTWSAHKACLSSLQRTTNKIIVNKVLCGLILLCITSVKDLIIAVFIYYNNYVSGFYYQRVTVINVTVDKILDSSLEWASSTELWRWRWLWLRSWRMNMDCWSKDLWQDKTDMPYWDLSGPCIFQHKFYFDYPVTESGPAMYDAGE